jgi:hypothetical protein
MSRVNRGPVGGADRGAPSAATLAESRRAGGRSERPAERAARSARRAPRGPTSEPCSLLTAGPPEWRTALLASTAAEICIEHLWSSIGAQLDRILGMGAGVVADPAPAPGATGRARDQRRSAPFRPSPGLRYAHGPMAPVPCCLSPRRWSTARSGWTVRPELRARQRRSPGKRLGMNERSLAGQCVAGASGATGVGNRSAGGLDPRELAPARGLPTLDTSRTLSEALPQIMSDFTSYSPELWSPSSRTGPDKLSGAVPTALGLLTPRGVQRDGQDQGA